MGTALRRQAERALADLGLTGPITSDQVKATLEAHRGRPIYIQTAPAAMFDNAACGAWWETEHIDLILVPEDADPMLQRHTVFHEFGHMILRHQGAACGTESITAVLRKIMPDLDPAKVLAMLARSGYEGPAEREAEMLASLLTLRTTDTATTPTNAETEALRQALAGTIHRG